MITMVIPVYNEGAAILQNLHEIEGELQKTGEEHGYLLVDDGSRDDTRQQLLRAAGELPHVRVVCLSRNFGKEAALCAGLERAEGDIVIVMDSDLQHPPRYIAEMLRLYRQGYDIVDGVKSRRADEPLLRRMGAALYYRLFSRLTGLAETPQSDFKLLSRRALLAWRGLPEKSTYFRGMSAWVGYSHVEMPFEVESRRSGRSRWSLKNLAGLFISSIIAYSALPLLFVGLIGAVMLIGAAILGVQTLYMYFSGRAATGFSTVILLQLLIGSCLMLGLSIIGLYLGKIYDEVKGRPRYLVLSDTGAAPKTDR